jgi:hypothetical protein
MGYGYGGGYGGSGFVLIRCIVHSVNYRTNKFGLMLTKPTSN